MKINGHYKIDHLLLAKAETMYLFITFPATWFTVKPVRFVTNDT
jgi:hypothetical protein